MKKKNSNNSQIKISGEPRDACSLSRDKKSLVLYAPTFAACIDSAKAKQCRSPKPAHPNAPVSKTHSEQIKFTLQKQRLKCAQLEQALSEMRAELQKSSMTKTMILTMTSCNSSIQHILK